MQNPIRGLSSVFVLSLASVLSLGSFAMAEATVLHVAVNGNDAWSGRLAEPKDGDGPFRTLERARDEIRKLRSAGGLPQGGVVVEIDGGTYELAAPLVLSAEDSGTEGSPIVYRAKKGEQVRLVGGRVVTGWQPVADEATLARLDESARGHVLQADLKALGIQNTAEMTPRARYELFFQRKPMTLARWPNEGFITIPKVLGATKIDNLGMPGCREGVLGYEGDRPQRWIGKPDAMLHGYFFFDWHDERFKITSIDVENRVITLNDDGKSPYGFRVGQWYYAYNLLVELDRPGEWYIDCEKGILYFWPPAPIEQGEPTLSLASSLVVLQGTSFVEFSHLLFEMCRDTAVVAEKASNVRIVGCTIRNVGDWAVKLQGQDCTVVGCDMHDMGSGGVHFTGGDRNTLTPGNLVADNNHIHDYSRLNRICQPGVWLSGVGNRATHNLIDNAPHQAVYFIGNDHLIEFNEIHSVCYESNDAGAIYAGRDWSVRGTKIQHNYFHDIQGFRNNGCVGVYFDDQMSGNEVRGNLFHKVSRAAMIGGGRDTQIVNNIFVDCVPSVHVDGRGLTWSHYHREYLEKCLKAVPYQSPIWAERYPSLVNILEDDPMAPKGNLIARNIQVGGRWADFQDKTDENPALVTLQDNLLGQDPRFVDAERGNFRLKDDSPALKMGFEQLPFDKMGLYDSPDRATWPVEHAVRETAPSSPSQ